MMAVTERFDDLRATAEAANWRGRSGRYYVLKPLPIDRFALTGGDLFLLARGPDVLWVGSEADVVGDVAVRAGFRAALRVANAAFHTAPPDNELDRMTMTWDLEDAEPVEGFPVR
jgi:hypothetical protein